MNWKERFIQEKARLETGLNQVYGFRSIAVIFLIVDVWLNSRFNYNLTTPLLITLGFLTVLFFWCVGLIWDRLKMYHYSAEFSNKRNPTIQTIKKKVLNR